MEKLRNLSCKEKLRNAKNDDVIYRISLVVYLLEKYGEEALLDFYKNYELANQIKLRMGKKNVFLMQIAKKLGNIAKPKIIEAVVISIIENMEWIINFECIKRFEIQNNRAVLQIENCSNKKAIKKIIRRLNVDIKAPDMCRFFCVPIYEETCKIANIKTSGSFSDNGCTFKFEI